MRTRLLAASLAAPVAALLFLARTTPAQSGPPADRGAAALAELVRGLGVNTRVLVIGAHPDDEDTQLITWLARGRQVDVAYLSLTRGDGGQNLLGNELGEALGAIRTEELLAARRLDGGHQYFTRAYDFGFSKSAAETYKHWPHDSLLRDVVTVVRSFRPHVIIAIFTGTPRDGHGQHQVSGLLAREAFDAAGDAGRFPASATAGLPAWTPLKFYRSARWFGGDAATLSFDVGEYSPLRGRSYAEIAAESRSQHKSQAMGSLQRKGAMTDYVLREESRVPAPANARQEHSIFDGIDTTWARVAHELAGAAAAVAAAPRVDSLPAAIAAVQREYDPYEPTHMLPALERVRHLAAAALARVVPCTPEADGGATVRSECQPANAAQEDAASALELLETRAVRALSLASAVGIEATVDHETWAAGEPVRTSVTVYDRAALPMRTAVVVPGARASAGSVGAGSQAMRSLTPLTSTTATDTTRITTISQPWWLAVPRHGDVFGVPGSPLAEDARTGPTASVAIATDSARFQVEQPIVYRYADPLKGTVEQPIAIVPAVTLTVDQPIQYVPADRPFERVIHVELRSASDHPRTVKVSLALPRGLTADSSVRTIVLPDYAGHFGAESEPRGMGRRVAASAPTRTVDFVVRGTLAPGRHTIGASAESEGQRYATGYTLVDYDHIRPQRLFRDATIELSAVHVQLAPRLNVAYVPGVGDNVAPMLQQLGVPITIIEPEKLATADLSRFTTVVVGPRAYESSAALVANNPRLLDFARAGHTLVVQYGQYEMASPGLMPYPVTLARPADRVTEEDATVRVLQPTSPLLTTPNRIGPADWQDWVQERSLYMPHTHDPRYTALLSMNDTGEPPNDGAILVAPLGKGTYVYTTLSLFRQLPAGNPGGARLFVNLLSAAQPASADGQATVHP